MLGTCDCVLWGGGWTGSVFVWEPSSVDVVPPVATVVELLSRVYPVLRCSALSRFSAERRRCHSGYGTCACQSLCVVIAHVYTSNNVKRRLGANRRRRRKRRDSLNRFEGLLCNCARHESRVQASAGAIYYYRRKSLVRFCGGGHLRTPYTEPIRPYSSRQFWSDRIAHVCACVGVCVTGEKKLRLEWSISCVWSCSDCSLWWGSVQCSVAFIRLASTVWAMDGFLFGFGRRESRCLDDFSDKMQTSLACATQTV